MISCSWLPQRPAASRGGGPDGAASTMSHRRRCRHRSRRGRSGTPAPWSRRPPYGAAWPESSSRRARARSATRRLGPSTIDIWRVSEGTRTRTREDTTRTRHGHGHGHAGRRDGGRFELLGGGGGVVLLTRRASVRYRQGDVVGSAACSFSDPEVRVLKPRRARRRIRAADRAEVNLASLRHTCGRCRARWAWAGGAEVWGVLKPILWARGAGVARTLSLRHRGIWARCWKRRSTSGGGIRIPIL